MEKVRDCEQLYIRLSKEENSGDLYPVSPSLCCAGLKSTSVRFFLKRKNLTEVWNKPDSCKLKGIAGTSPLLFAFEK